SSCDVLLISCAGDGISVQVPLIAAGTAGRKSHTAGITERRWTTGRYCWCRGDGIYRDSCRFRRRTTAPTSRIYSGVIPGRRCDVLLTSCAGDGSVVQVTLSTAGTAGAE